MVLPPESSLLKERRDEVDIYFTLDNQWLQTFSKIDQLDDINKEVIKTLIKQIDPFPDERIRITFNYTDWLEPLESGIHEAQEMNLQTVETESSALPHSSETNKKECGRWSRPLILTLKQILVGDFTIRSHKTIYSKVLF